MLVAHDRDRLRHGAPHDARREHDKSPRRCCALKLYAPGCDRSCRCGDLDVDASCGEHASADRSKRLSISRRTRAPASNSRNCTSSRGMHA